MKETRAFFHSIWRKSEVLGSQLIWISNIKEICDENTSALCCVWKNKGNIMGKYSEKQNHATWGSYSNFFLPVKHRVTVCSSFLWDYHSLWVGSLYISVLFQKRVFAWMIPDIWTFHSVFWHNTGSQDCNIWRNVMNHLRSWNQPPSLNSTDLEFFLILWNFGCWSISLCLQSIVGSLLKGIFERLLKHL